MHNYYKRKRGLISYLMNIYSSHLTGVLRDSQYLHEAGNKLLRYFAISSELIIDSTLVHPTGEYICTKDVYA